MTRCSECILLIRKGVLVFPGIQGFGHRPGSSPQPPASTHDNAHVTVVAELNMLFRNKTQNCFKWTRAERASVSKLNIGTYYPPVHIYAV